MQQCQPEGARYNPAAIPRAPRRTPFQDVREDQSLQNIGRADLDAHGTVADVQARREWFARNDPSTPKLGLIEQIGGTVLQKPVRYTSTPWLWLSGHKAFGPYALYATLAEGTVLAVISGLMVGGLIYLVKR